MPGDFMFYNFINNDSAERRVGPAYVTRTLAVRVDVTLVSRWLFVLREFLIEKPRGFKALWSGSSAFRQLRLHYGNLSVDLGHWKGRNIVHRKHICKVAPALFLIQKNHLGT